MPADFQLVHGDLANETALEGLPGHADAVIHLAAASSTEEYSLDEMVLSNVDGMRNLIGYALRVGAQRFIYASTLSIHGDIHESVVTEQTPIQNPDAYGLTKYLGELLLVNNSKNLSSVALRLPGVLGPGAHRHWLSSVLKRAKQNADIRIFNPDADFNNAVHVKDLSRFFLTLLKTDWPGFSAMPLGAGGCTTIRAAVERVVASSGASSRIIEKKGEKESFRISSKLAVNDFGYAPMSIEAMLDDYAHNG
jgi:UDP-glucose 4-epimerase